MDEMNWKEYADATEVLVFWMVKCGFVLVVLGFVLGVLRDYIDRYYVEKDFEKYHPSVPAAGDIVMRREES